MRVRYNGCKSIGGIDMRIMLVNDDGVFASGIYALADQLRARHTVVIVAPDSERSVAGRSMTLDKPLHVEKVELLDLDNVDAYSVSGTPVDCTRLGLSRLFPNPDMVIAGINMGYNLCTDVLYSGTVGAAAEAALCGIPAIAVSNCSYFPKHLETSAVAAELAADYLSEHPLPFGQILSINTPDVPFPEIRGFRTCRTGRVGYPLEYEMKQLEDGSFGYLPARGRIYLDDAPDTDEAAVRELYISVTPLGFDLTAHDLIPGISL